MKSSHVLRPAILAGLLVSFAGVPALAGAQDTQQDQQQNQTGQIQTLQGIIVTGSRIKQTNAVTSQPVLTLTHQQLEATGLKTVGDVLQQLTASGKALSAKFNSSGNFGYPPDGGGIGAGSAQVDLRNLGSKRVLVLVDGLRWVNESSASGVSGAVDLNTIPIAIIDRIEVLEDGASAIYGSDAIAGVVNIITRKTFDGAQVHAYFGRYSDLGGDTKNGDLTFGGHTDKFSGIFSASYFSQDAISSALWPQSSVPEPGAGLAAGSSATPQGRLTFCDPSIAFPAYGSCSADQSEFYDITLNNGTTNPNYNKPSPDQPPGTYHDWSSADRFNFAPYNLLLTPNKRKSLYTSIQYNISDNVHIHAKALYNNRTSSNQAAPEPIFIGPYAGTGGLADHISVSHLNPFNPFGIDLCADASPTCGDGTANLGWVTRRPVEIGPRIYNQDVNTTYFNVGMDGLFNIGDRGYNWNADLVHTDNKADQVFFNGYNLAHMSLALGDPSVCAQVPGCVPLDLFGGQSRPITPEMADWILATQHDSSKQVMDLFNANISGDMFAIGDREADFAAGVEHRRYQGDFEPDPLRQNGESQDSVAFPVNASYKVDEGYAEFNFPILASLSIDPAVRLSHYSTFGSATTGKIGLRWQPIEDLVLRGTWSQGFRAPNIGELFGLTTFAATLVDPCGPSDGSGPAPQFAAGCAAQGVPAGFTQANTQIIAFTGGNPNLQPEKSHSYTAGFVYSPSWLEHTAWSDRVDLSMSYYHYKIDNAIQAEDIQALLDACLAAGGTSPTLCAPFSRQAGGNLNPPQNKLQNIGTVLTDGVDIKFNWASPEWSWGRLTAALQSTRVFSFSQVDTLGIASQRMVGIEVSDSAIPSWQTNIQLGWMRGDFDANWNVRYIAGVKEACANAVISSGIPGCADSSDFHHLGATTYNDVQLGWKDVFALKGLKLSIGVNNIFDRDPPICLTCSLNGYDAGTYDLPGRFWYVDANYKF